MSGNLSICQNNTLTIYNNSLVIYDLYVDFEFDQAGNATYRVLYSIDRIYTSCYFMIFEYYLGINLYFAVMTNVWMVLYNFLHNLGSIYDLCEEFYYLAIDYESLWETVWFWGRIGFIIGSNFHNLFEYPRNYDMVSNDYQNHKSEREEFEYD